MTRPTCADARARSPALIAASSFYLIPVFGVAGGFPAGLSHYVRVGFHAVRRSRQDQEARHSCKTHSPHSRQIQVLRYAFGWRSDSIGIVRSIRAQRFP